MMSKFKERECDFVTTPTLARICTLDYISLTVINQLVCSYMSLHSRLANAHIVLFCLTILIIVSCFSFFSLSVFLSFPTPKCKKASPGNDPSLCHNINNNNNNNNDNMAKKKNNDKRRREDEDDDQRRRRREEDEKKRRAREKKARRPALADTSADLGLGNLLNEGPPPSSTAGLPAAADPISIAHLFEHPTAAEDKLLESDRDDDEDHCEDGEVDDDAEEEEEEEEEEVAEAPPYSEDEGMEVDPIEDPPPQAPSAQAPPTPQAGRPKTAVTMVQASPEEMEVGLRAPWAPSKLADGSVPQTTREVGCQANLGRQTLGKRREWLTAARKRYKENKRKRARSASPPPAPTTTIPSVVVTPPPPPQKVQKPAFLQPKRPRPFFPDASKTPSQKEVQGQKAGTSLERKAGQSANRRGKGRSPAQRSAQDQRVVVFVPPEIPAAKQQVAPKQAVSNRPPSLATLPHRPAVQEPGRRGRSISCLR